MKKENSEIVSILKQLRRESEIHSYSSKYELMNQLFIIQINFIYNDKNLFINIVLTKTKLNEISDKRSFFLSKINTRIAGENNEDKLFIVISNHIKEVSDIITAIKKSTFAEDILLKFDYILTIKIKLYSHYNDEYNFLEIEMPLQVKSSELYQKKHIDEHGNIPSIIVNDFTNESIIIHNVYYIIKNYTILYHLNNTLEGLRSINQNITQIRMVKSLIDDYEKLIHR